jgi:hypothetical protein
MKHCALFVLFSVVLAFSCPAQEGGPLDLKTLFSFDYVKPEHPNPEHLSIIRYILQNTYENYTHKMRGETDNRVYTNEDGREAVVDKNGELVTNSYNRGSFNYFSNKTEPVKKFIFDTAPWLKWGNAPDDPTSFNERLYSWTLDLNYGIQSYIFEGSSEQRESVPFDDLSENEKEVYVIFLKILFNEDYKIALNSENRERLVNDGTYYYEYFYQIQELLQVKQ